MDFMNQLRIIAVKIVPPNMKNIFYNGTEQNGPEFLDWHAWFSATERTYVYRILHRDDSFALPFEWDRSLRIKDCEMLNVDARKEAARHLVGTLDVSSFRGAHCERNTPVVNMKDIAISSQPYWLSSELGFSGLSSGASGSSIEEQHPTLVAIKIVGQSFVYRQVRNMVGCLLEVGREKYSPDDLK
jgi:tRNA pseudouridine38-40 synthase